MDETLSGYGAYSTTAYPTPREVQNYPKLFLFYKLPEGEKVICLSEYVGNDLHSFPARAGNYIAHSLVCQNCEPFNVVQAYLDRSEEGLERLHNLHLPYLTIKAGYWKTIDQVKEEDAGATAPYDIEPLTIENLNAFDWYPQPFQALFKGDNGIRRDMFLQAVNAILSRKKVIIVDESDKLIHWTFTLLQSFPPAFVFQHLNIASFANSNVLLDLCNVICFELELEDRLKRYESDDRILINYNNPPKSIVDRDEAIYANTLFISGMTGRLDGFRHQIDRAFKSPYEPYSLSDLNRNAFYFNGLYKVHTMSEVEFKEFYSKCSDSPERIHEIFIQIKECENWEKCPVIWEASLPINSISKLNEVYKYTIEPYTDKYWTVYEKNVLPDIECSIEDLINYASSTNINSLERANTILEAALSIVQKNSSYEIKKRAIKLFENLIPLSYQAKKGDFDEIKTQIERIEKLRSLNIKDRIIQFAKYIDTINKIEFKELEFEIGNIDWEAFFLYIDDISFNDALIKILKDSRTNPLLLPNKSIALDIVLKKYDEDPDSFYNHYKLAIHDQSAIYKHAPKVIKKIIDSQKPITTIDDLESNLQSSDEKDDHLRIMNKFVKDVTSYKTTYLLWELAQLIESNNTLYPNIVSADATSIRMLYNYLNDSNVEIPENYINLAIDLKIKNKINRQIPNKSAVFINDELKNVFKASDFIKLNSILDEERITRENIESLVKLPWDCHTWEFLYEHLNLNQKESLPDAISRQLLWSNGNKTVLSHERWCYLACEYIVFLILNNMTNEFLKCVNSHIFIDWIEYQYIEKRLLCLIIKNDNECFTLFKRPDRRSWIRKGEGPYWKIKTNNAP
ncbi:MAG: hypothetical protein HUU34_08545 [Saprospiraceae bacterium]|nr:hypothetical protein [Saprospiraceae bacterium]